MAFVATEFIFDDINSSFFGLYIGGTNNGGSGGSCMKVNNITELSGVGVRQNLLGVKYDTPLTFTLNLFSKEPIDKIDISKILNWLCGRHTYCKLQILQDDLEGVYFNCLITDPNIGYFGNKAHTLSVTVVCDSPFAYTFERRDVYVANSWTFNNISDHWDFLIPNSVEIVCNSGDVTVNNIDAKRTLVIKNRKDGEIIRMCEYTGLVKSSSGLRVLDDFNKVFLRFSSGVNKIEMTNVKSIIVKYSFVRKVDG